MTGLLARSSSCLSLLLAFVSSRHAFFSHLGAIPTPTDFQFAFQLRGHICGADSRGAAMNPSGETRRHKEN